MPNESENYVGIVKRGLKEEWCRYIRREYEFSMAVCRSLASDIEAFVNEVRGELKEGPLFYRAVKSDIPPCVKTDEMSFKTVKLTIFSQDDVEDAKKSQRELLKNRVVRLTNEAFEQGTLLTQADLSILLNESIKTIGRHIKKLLEEDIVVPTRGNRMDIGQGTSHKAKIVELYLKGYEFTEIKRNTRHSSDSIARYLKEFARVAALHHEGYSLGQIRRMTEHSEKLVKEYLELYEWYKEEENCKQRMGEILSRYSGENFERGKSQSKGGDVKMHGSELNKEERFNMIRRKLEQRMKDEIKALIEKDYSIISGEKVREMFASDILRLIEQRYDYEMNIDSGQVMRLGVKREERQNYGKNASNTEIVPVKLTLLSLENIDMLSSRFTSREVREIRMIRLFKEGYEQGGVLSSNDIALLLNVSPSTVSKQVREYKERTKEVVPTRGTVHDLGRAITHKRIIIRLYLEGYLTPEIARMTKHSEEACDRYIRAFNKVRMLADRNMSAEDIVRTLEMSSFTVKEYLNI